MPSPERGPAVALDGNREVQFEVHLGGSHVLLPAFMRCGGQRLYPLRQRLGIGRVEAQCQVAPLGARHLVYFRGRGQGCDLVVWRRRRRQCDRLPGLQIHKRRRTATQEGQAKHQHPEG